MIKFPAIQLSGLSKFYGLNRGIENVDLTVEEGEIFGFIGPNGAGKSTTIRILLNLIFPTSGSASMLGMDVIRQSRKIRQISGYVPSDADAYKKMSVRDFLSYCMRFYGTNDDSRIDSLTGMFELDPDRIIGDLSMGNRKKVAILQGVIHKPRLLILDEPTTGLDPLMQSRFFELLRSENEKGMTIFFSSHILSEIQLFCKRVAIIREGRIIKVEEINTLRRKQLKKVRVSFSDKSSAETFSTEGVGPVEIVSESEMVFMYPGLIDDLLHRLTGLKLANLTIEEPSLEEIFMHYYR